MVWPTPDPASSSSSLSSLELSHTKVYEPKIRDLLGTAGFSLIRTWEAGVFFIARL